MVVIFYRILAKLALPSVYSVLFGWSDAKTRRETDKAASALEVVPSVVDFGALGNSEGKTDDLPKTPEQDDAWRRGRIAKQGEGEVLKHGTEVLTKVLVYGGIGESQCSLDRSFRGKTVQLTRVKSMLDL